MNQQKYHVEFYDCPAHIPFHFARHTWIAIHKENQSSRWEVIHKKYKNKTRFGYVYKNFYTKTNQGIKKHTLSNQYWKARKIGELSGDQNSLAHQIIEFIETRSSTYPYQNNYTLYPGPNSNTYTAWVLKHFPEAKIKLPWNAFGKDF